MSLIKNAGKAIGDVIPGLGRFTFDPTVGNIFITSGTGVVGYRVALSLLEAGHKNIRVGIYREDRQTTIGRQCADILESKGADVVDFDWCDPESYKTALKDVKTVFCALPHIEGWSDAFPAFLTQCKNRKVEHFVKMSFLRPTHSFKGVAEVARQYRENVPFVSFHSICDDLLELAKSDSRISYTILCTSHLMSSPVLAQGYTLREEHKFVSASYGMGVNYVSPNDVADAAVVVLLNQKPFRNKIYNLTGPHPIKDADVVKLLTKHYGSDIEHVELGYHEYKKDVESRGIPAYMANDAAMMERMKAMGLDEFPESYTNDLEVITGRPAETFEEYLSHASSMRPGSSFRNVQ